MTDVIWNNLARNDLLNIVSYIADDNIDAAQSLKNDIEEKVMNLVDFPKMGRLGRVCGTRELVVFSNYIIVYIEEEFNIQILRLLHASQKWPS